MSIQGQNTLFGGAFLIRRNFFDKITTKLGRIRQQILQGRMAAVEASLPHATFGGPRPDILSRVDACRRIRCYRLHSGSYSVECAGDSPPGASTASQSIVVQGQPW